MATREPTCQFAATARECELIRAMRAVEKSIAPIQQTRLYQTLELSVKDEGSDSLGSCVISPEDIMMEFLRAGIGFYQEMMKDHVQQFERSTQVDEGVHIHDHDSVSGPQSREVPEDLAGQEDEERTMSWDTIKESIIPSSVKEITFTLDDDHSMLHKEELQSRFPGVIITMPSEVTQKEQIAKNHELEKPIGVKRVAEPNSASSHKADPIKHMQDLADYVSEPPGEGEFSYKCPLVESWGILAFQIKLEIAHARAIQNHHGKVTDGNACSHCRLQCDLPTTGKDRRPSVPTAPAALRVDTNSPVPPSITSSANAIPRSLASRMTIPDGYRLGGREVTSGTPGGAIQTRTPASANPNGSIVDYANELGIVTPFKTSRVIYFMYDLLRIQRKVAPYGEHNITLQQYYKNLVTLYVLTYKRKEYNLAYIVLLRFQSTNYKKIDELPSEATAVRAFEHLPTTSPVNRWITILYSFLWGNESLGSYDEFMNTHPELRENIPAFTKMHYEVSLIRDSHTPGRDAAVLRRWCNVHNHSAGRPEDKEICESSIMDIQLTLEEADRQEDERELEHTRDVYFNFHGREERE
ncbi:hypothetical protein DDE82_000702 [Stemphylium lycopersici]|uniref:Uncharacterized protein n=1 Tax=Stemphylium lycopersici TaxID=183478 RepID=A0A364N9B5_STELY|nr:hypothetical protein DDE82_000702 [Stemphylium lycopersici]RAR13934.1 hypothetical protein DDE83_002664 [Stemphylium lycopersici]